MPLRRTYELLLQQMKQARRTGTVEIKVSLTLRKLRYSASPAPSNGY